MMELISRLNELQSVGYYEAPDDAHVSPAKIPGNVDIVELITGGEVYFEIDGQMRSFGKGSIFWHTTDDETIYRTTREKPYRCAVFRFSVKDRNRPVPRVSFWNPKYDIDKFYLDCLKVFHEKKTDEKILALYIYSVLLHHATTSIDSAEENYPGAILRALKYIENNLDKKISIALLARKSRISEPQLFKLFQKHLDTTPHNYILAQQLAKARTMLASTTTPIKVIAAECGFNNIEVFYRCFYKESSITPAKYRSQNIFNL